MWNTWCGSFKALDSLCYFKKLSCENRSSDNQQSDEPCLLFPRDSCCLDKLYVSCWKFVLFCFFFSTELHEVNDNRNWGYLQYCCWILSIYGTRFFFSAFNLYCYYYYYLFIHFNWTFGTVYSQFFFHFCISPLTTMLLPKQWVAALSFLDFSVKGIIISVLSGQPSA